jgi:hypothetical protein
MRDTSTGEQILGPLKNSAHGLAIPVKPLRKPEWGCARALITETYNSPENPVKKKKKADR